MPAARRQLCKATPRPPLQSPAAPTSPSAVPAVASLAVASPIVASFAVVSPAASLASATSTVYHTAASEPKTPENKPGSAAKESLPTPTTKSQVLTGYGTLNGETSIAVVGVPTADGVYIPPQNKESASCKTQNEPADPVDNLFIGPAPGSPQVLKSRTLTEVVRRTHQKVMGARRFNNPNPLSWLTTPVGRTGVPVLDKALNDLRLSRFCLWIGNPHMIQQNCTWVTGGRASIATLQWRADAPNKGPDSEGDAVFGIIGMVSSQGASMDADCKYQVGWGLEKLPKYKRSVRLVCPDSSFHIPQHYWDAQREGALHIAQTVCPSEDASQQISYCFDNKEGDYLCFRSPLFLPSDQCVQENHRTSQDQSAFTEDEPLGNRDGYGFETWNMSSQTMREAFRGVIKEGYKPQALEAYTRFNTPIHPNAVSATLTGAVVLINFTLEQLRFMKDNQTRTEFQVHANILRVQVLKPAPPPKPLVIKRKFVHSYGPNNGLGLEDESADGPGSDKKLKRVHSVE
ncbi:hypothetical protein FRC07_009213 [Ceratobasidium sp. 392]|nr:hypothetical protein FRC07_009213 [Ceratobasidium sp. 392]